MTNKRHVRIGLAKLALTLLLGFPGGLKAAPPDLNTIDHT
jgi:hypothetical protein